MPTEVILPKVDMDMATGQISRWFYKEGDTIKKGEPLFEIETDKAAMEVDAPASGTLGRVTGAEGVDIAVGAAVAWIYAEGEAIDTSPAQPSDAGESRAIEPEPDVDVDSRSISADEAGVIAPEKTGAGDAEARPPSSAEGDERNGVRATPLARRIARERGIDLSDIAGRGPSGRIQREDVERAANETASSARADRPAPEKSARPTTIPGVAEAQDATPTAGGSLHLTRLREGEGTPIVLVHGFGSESASWRPLLGELTDDGNPVVGVDLAGHGGSVGLDAADFDALVAGVEDALTGAGLASCHLVGHSLGGAVCAAVAAGVASDVRSLMLVAPAGFGPDIDTGFVEGFARATDDAPIRAWLHHLVTDPAVLSDGFVRATARARADGQHATAQTRLAKCLFSNGTQHFEVRSLVQRLAVPVKIVAGAEDRVIPVRHFTGLPGAIALHVFPRTGHLPHLEQRTEVARLLHQLVR